MDDRRRHDAAKLPDDDEVASRNGRRDLRQVTTANGGSRPPRATESATNALSEDAGLAVVVVAWPKLPDTVRAGILATIKATMAGEG
jgi:hypothetical protein